MSNGSHDAGPIPPDNLRCTHRHKDAEDSPTSINPDPHCPGRCRLLAGHPHLGERAPVLAALGPEATPYLDSEAVSYQGVWEYNPGICCKCEKCGKWVKDWGTPKTVTD
jgi:hypothetical protein